MRVNTRLTNKSIELWTKINPSGPFGEFSVFLLTTDRLFSFSTSIGSCHAVLVVIVTGNSNYTGPTKRSACIIGIIWTNEKRNIYEHYPSPTFILFHWRRIYITSFEALFSANCPVLRMLGCFLLPPRHSRFFARIARWKLLSLRKTKETKHHKTSLTMNLTTNLTLTIVHKKRKRIN